MSVFYPYKVTTHHTLNILSPRTTTFGSKSKHTPHDFAKKNDLRFMPFLSLAEVRGEVPACGSKLLVTMQQSRLFRPRF